MSCVMWGGVGKGEEGVWADCMLHPQCLHTATHIMDTEEQRQLVCAEKRRNGQN